MFIKVYNILLLALSLLFSCQALANPVKSWNEMKGTMSEYREALESSSKGEFYNDSGALVPKPTSEICEWYMNQDVRIYEVDRIGEVNGTRLWLTLMVRRGC